MRLAFPVLLVAILARPSAAQSPSVSLTVTLDRTIQRNGGQRPIIQLNDLLTDERWARELDNSLPLIVNYQVETWRSRDGWIDELMGTVTWQTIVQKEPLQDEYAVSIVVQDQVQRPQRFGIRDSAAAYLNLRQRVETYPLRAGRFYYHVTARITVLSDRDMDQLERFLAGDPDLDIPARGTQVGRGIRRFLLRIAGLPSQDLQARSEQFNVRPNDD